MIFNEYKQCLLCWKDSVRSVWMPPNGCRLNAAVDLDNNGCLWHVIHVYHDLILSEDQVKELIHFTPGTRWVEGWSESKA